jgi:hypothetical protein
MSEQKIGGRTRVEWANWLDKLTTYAFDDEDDTALTILLDVAFSAEARVQRLEELRQAVTLYEQAGLMGTHGGALKWIDVARAALAAPDKEK